MGDGHFGASYAVDGFDVGDPLSSGLGARIPEWGLVALSTEPGAFDPGASFSSGAATGLITRTGSNKFELSAQVGGPKAPGATPWLTDAGVLAAGRSSRTGPGSRARWRRKRDGRDRGRRRRFDLDLHEADLAGEPAEQAVPADLR